MPYGELTSALMPTAQYLEQNPLPRPAVISSVDVRPNQLRDLCFTVNTYPPTPSTTASEGVKHSIQIDGYSALLSAIFGTGSYSSQCAYVGNLSVGLHLASAEVTTRDGIEHTYTWAFRIEPTPDA